MHLPPGRRPPSLALRIISFALASYLRLVYATSRWSFEGLEIKAQLEGQPHIGAFWHARLAAMPYLFRGESDPHMLISAHRDGEFIAQTIRWFGVASVRGSTARRKPGQAAATDKGGAAALRALVRVLKNGGSVGITPDGPRGPRMRVSPGTVMLAALAQAPILCASFSSKRAIRFKSWDRFMLPLPFDRIHVAIGGPIRVSGRGDDAALAAARLHIEEALTMLTNKCDARLGRDLVAPEPARAPAALEEPT